MAGVRWLETDTLSNQNISSALAIGAYTANADRAVMVQVFLDQVAGNGDYVFYVTLQIGGAGSSYVILSRSTLTALAGDTAIGGQSEWINVRNGDVVTVYVDGLAGDTTTPDTIVRWFEDASLQPTTPDRTLDVAATGEAGIDLTNKLDTTGILPNIAAGASGGLFIAGANAATSIATALTANITGDLSGSVGSVTGDIGGNVLGTVATVNELAQSALADLFNTDSGETSVTAIDGSVVKEIMDGLCTPTVFPSGAIEFTYTVTDINTGLPIEGVEVWVSTNNPAVNIVWKGDTDAFGIARDVLGNKPWLDAGTYYFWRQKVGYTFTEPDTEVVS